MQLVGSSSEGVTAAPASASDAGGSIVVGASTSHAAAALASLFPARPPPLDSSIFSHFLDGPGGADAAGSEPGESAERRLLDLRLQQNYYAIVLEPFPIPTHADWRDMWLKHIPALALGHDNVLYAMLTYSATNLLMAMRAAGAAGAAAAAEQERAVLYAARQRYLVLALAAQRRVVVGGLTADNADVVCLASVMIVVNAFAMLGERVLLPPSGPRQGEDEYEDEDEDDEAPLVPYDPPLDWLHMGRGVGQTVYAAIEALERAGRAHMPSQHVFVIADSYPYFGRDRSYWDAEMRVPYAAVLSSFVRGPPRASAVGAGAGDGDEEEEEDGDEEEGEEDLGGYGNATRAAYELALSWVGSLQRAIDGGEPAYVLGRRIQGFSFWVPDRFVEVLAEGRPRALVVLAHFFAAVAQVRGLWWLGAGGGGRDRDRDREQRAGRGGGGAEGGGEEEEECEGVAKREVLAISRAVPAKWRGLLVGPLDAIGVKPFWP
jgi:hypothetical protein